MVETFNDGDLDRVWHLSQIGFSYTEDEPCKFSAYASDIFLSYSRSTSGIVPKLLLNGTNPE